MSAPDTKALPPAPATTTQRISSSPSSSARMRGTASHMSSETALCRAGLLKSIQPVDPSLRRIILSIPPPTDPSIRILPATTRRPVVADAGEGAIAGAAQGVRSIGVAVGPAGEDGAAHDLQVEGERPVVDVIEVVLDAAAHGVLGVGRSAQAVDLRPPGDARLDVVAAGIEPDAPLEGLIVRHRVRPRTDERHVAEEHVQELRQLVDVPAPQKAADQRHAIVASARLAEIAVVVDPHGAEFIDPERLLVEAVALLAEHRRAGAVEPDQERDENEERQQQHEAERRADDVEQALRDDLQKG